MRAGPPLRGPARPALVGGFALVVAALWATAATYAVHGQMPRNVLRLPLESQIRPLLPWIAPEGWAFFTRSAREPKLYALTRSTNGWRDASLGPHGRVENLFGLDRRSRAQGVEIALLLGTVRETALSECRDELAACLDRIAAIPLRNTSPAPTLCGDVGIAQREPLPWAWHEAAHTVMPSRVVRLRLEC